MPTPASALLLALATAAPPAPVAGPLAGMLDLLPVLAIFGVFYFLVLRPASRQRRAQQEALAALKKDDEVVTQGGVWGRVVHLDARVVTLEVADRVRLRILRDRIAGPWQAAAEGPTASGTAVPAASRVAK